MKHFLTVLLLLICAGAQAQTDKHLGLYTAAGLRSLLRDSKTDTLLKVERMAAMEFHRQINAYRKTQGVDTLCWNDTLWLAARNHDIWMISHHGLDHHEKAGTPCFTGADPGDRYFFAADGYARFHWSGENILNNWAGTFITFDTTARNIADESFSIWKNSPGHNANMLNNQSVAHAVAFVTDPVDKSFVWATDIFSYNPSGDYIRVALTADQQVSAALVVAPADPVSPVKARQQLLSKLYSDAQVSKDAVLAGAASAHAKYLQAHPDAADNEEKGDPDFSGKTVEERVKAAAGGDKQYKKMTVTERCALIEIPADAFDCGEAAEKIMSGWSARAGGRAGIGVEVKRVKNVLKITAVIVSGS